MNQLKKITKDITCRYQKRSISIQINEIKKLIYRLHKQAKEQYKSLPTPKFCSPKAYISLWINQEITKDIAIKCLNTVSTDNPPQDLKETIKFFQNNLYQQLSPQTQKSVQVSATKDYLKVISEKNIFAQNRGYKSYLDMRLKNEQVPQSDYQKFLKNINFLIKNSKKYILPQDPIKPIQINPCFICRSKPLSFKNIKTYINLFSKKYPLFKKHHKRIQIKLSNSSSSEYLRENDSFQININKNISLNHQIIDFLHETCHLELMIKIFKQNLDINPNPYITEKNVIKKEIKMIKKYLPEMFIPKINYMLTTILQTLFEIKLFQNTHQDPHLLYQKLLKQFSYYHQDRKNEFLFNKAILYQNLSQLNYAIAYNSLLINIFSKK